ncbi:MAG: proteasome activator [Actinoallomurus sp.]
MVDEPASPPPELLSASSSTGISAPDGAPGTPAPAPAPAQSAGVPAESEDRPLDPEKLLRLAGLVRAVLDEARQIDPDQATASELGALHRRVTAQIEDALPNALRDELQAIDLAPGADSGADAERGGGSDQPAGATGQEVRFAYAGLIGWLSGLFQGLQAAMQFQQLQAANGLPSGGGQGGPSDSDGRELDIEPGTGHYL